MLQCNLFARTSRFLKVERERDKERLENKRRQDQLKKVFDEEKDENKKKLVEVSNSQFLSPQNTFYFH